jgi:hypothetical protein
MATWKRLARTDGKTIDVNMETVLHMQQLDDHTAMFFAVTTAGDHPYMVQVKETPDEIHRIAALPGA